jgi:hypothetical protein
MLLSHNSTATCNYWVMIIRSNDPVWYFMIVLSNAPVSYMCHSGVQLCLFDKDHKPLQSIQLDASSHKTGGPMYQSSAELSGCEPFFKFLVGVWFMPKVSLIIASSLFCTVIRPFIHPRFYNAMQEMYGISRWMDFLVSISVTGTVFRGLAAGKQGSGGTPLVCCWIHMPRWCRGGGSLGNGTASRTFRNRWSPPQSDLP